MDLDRSYLIRIWCCFTWAE